MKTKQRFLSALLMAIVMMAMSPLKMWAQDLPEVTVGTQTIDLSESHQLAFTFKATANGYYSFTADPSCIMAILDSKGNPSEVAMNTELGVRLDKDVTYKGVIMDQTESITSLTLTVACTPDIVHDFGREEAGAFNFYTFTPTVTGTYSFSVDGGMLYVIKGEYTSLTEEMFSNTIAMGLAGSCQADCEADQKYTVLAMSSAANDNLTLTIARCKKAAVTALEKGENTVVFSTNTSFDPQYSFTPETTGYYQIDISNYADGASLLISSSSNVMQDYMAQFGEEANKQLSSGKFLLEGEHTYYFLAASVGANDIDGTITISDATAFRENAVYNSTNKTLTFYCDDTDHSSEGVLCPVNPALLKWPWLAYKEDIKKVVFDQSFASVRMTDCTELFLGLKNLKTIEGLSYLNTSEVTDMSMMFDNCEKLTSLDLSTFSSAKLTNTRYMFSGCINLTSITFGSNFTMEKVENAQGMFSGCSEIKVLDLTNFKTTKLRNTQRMFYACYNLITILASSDFTVNTVTSSDDMFAGCGEIKGEEGTRFNNSYLDKTYARIDGGESNPGYFSTYDICLDESAKYSSYPTIDTQKSYNILVKRTMKAGKWNTLTLPFYMIDTEIRRNFGYDVEVKKLTSITDNTVNFNDASEIVAGEPYIVKPTSDISIIYVADRMFNTKFSYDYKDLNDYNAYGYYCSCTYNGENSNMYILNDNQFYYVNSDVTVKGFRWFLEEYDGDFAKQLTINFDGETTAIDEIANGKVSNGTCYNLAGQRVNANQKGMVIINGKKYINK